MRTQIEVETEGKLYAAEECDLIDCLEICEGVAQDLEQTFDACLV